MIRRLHEREAVDATRVSSSLETSDSAADQELADEFRELLERARGRVSSANDEVSALSIALAQGQLVAHTNQHKPVEHRDEVAPPQAQSEGELEDQQTQEDSPLPEPESTHCVGHTEDVTTRVIEGQEGEQSEGVEQLAPPVEGVEHDEGAADPVDMASQVAPGAVEDISEEVLLPLTVREESETSVSVKPDQIVENEVQLAPLDLVADQQEVPLVAEHVAQEVASAEVRSITNPDVSAQKGEISPQASIRSMSDAVPVVESQTTVAAEPMPEGDFQWQPRFEKTAVPTQPLVARELSSQRGADLSIQLAILRQAFEGVKGLGFGQQEAGSKANISSNQAANQGVSTAGEARNLRGELQSRSSKPMNRAQIHRMLERVESAMKEAARSRDGKTIRFRVEPLNLGEIKVDVSLREGVLHARLKAESHQVATLLRDKAHDLQGTLRKLGLDVDKVTVTVSEEDSTGFAASEHDLSNGKSFQEERNNMPGSRAQVAENTIGNELADVAPMSTSKVTNAILDHWVA